MIENQYCGIITIIGRTNVGKSTLFNKLINQKISITSHKINTTQKNIVGILTKKIYQYIFIDSPGFDTQKKIFFKKKILKDDITNKSCLILFVIQALKWTLTDQKILEWIIKKNVQYFIIINKIDLIKNKKLLLPFIKKISQKNIFNKIFLLSAKKDFFLKKLISEIKKKIPKKKHIYLLKKKTTCTKKFLIKEILRKSLLKCLHQEIPYNIKILPPLIRKYKDKAYFIKIFIKVKNLRYKKILIGKNGKKIKFYRKSTKYILEKMFKKKIYLIIIIILEKSTF
ncbi:GTPase Era [Buchnera aphidicola]|uniref:GTPase Era n=1 Tax=Buchnera aphidicola TaxID=9 RepID=UPI0031B67E50